MLDLRGAGWGGNDGMWSLFHIQVGTPPQGFMILPSLNTPEVILPKGSACSDIPGCGLSRGSLNNNSNPNGFDPGDSSSWRPNDFYQIPLVANITNKNHALLGNDNLSFLDQSTPFLTMDDTLIAAYENGSSGIPDFWMGSIGLSPFNLCLANETDAQSNLMESLKSKGHIESLSLAYTAGASNRPGRPSGHLTLGGFDDNLMDKGPEASLEFSFGQEPLRPFSVVLKTILTSNSTGGNEMSLMGAHINALIDTSLPYFWLPRDACDMFQEAFSLTYDEQHELYLVNETVHANLLSINATITFRLSPDTTTKHDITIEFPYSAFDHQLGFPLTNRENQTYFPIKRADADDQIVLGRAFLQEVYLVADYERRNFTIARRSFDHDDTVSNLVAIKPPLEPSNRLGLFDILWIASGSLAFVLLVLIVAGLLWRRRVKQRGKLQQKKEIAPYDSPRYDLAIFGADDTRAAAEADASVGYTEFGQGELRSDQTPRLRQLSDDATASRYGHPTQIYGLYEMAAESVRSVIKGHSRSRRSQKSQKSNKSHKHHGSRSSSRYSQTSFSTHPRVPRIPVDSKKFEYD